MKRPRDYSDNPEHWQEDQVVDATYFGATELPIVKPILVQLLIIAFVILILGWYFWPSEVKASSGSGIVETAIGLPWLWAFFVAGIVAVFALGLIQIFDAIVWAFREYPSRATAAAVVAFFVVASIGSAFSHEAPTGWSYPLSCCWSPSNAPAGRPGDCAEIAASTVVEAPDGYRITLREGDHPVVNSTITITIPYGREQLSPDGAYHLCLSDAMTPRCFFAGARGS